MKGILKRCNFNEPDRKKLNLNIEPKNLNCKSEPSKKQKKKVSIPPAFPPSCTADCHKKANHHNLKWKDCRADAKVRIEDVIAPAAELQSRTSCP